MFGFMKRHDIIITAQNSMHRARYVPQNAAGGIHQSPAPPIKVTPNIAAEITEITMKIILDFIVLWQSFRIR